MYSNTCDEGTPVGMSKLHFLWTKMYFNIEVYLRRGDTCHVGTLTEVSPNHRFYCMYIHMYGHSKRNIVICLGEWQSKAIHTMYIMFILSYRITHVVTHLLSERVLPTHWIGVVLIQGILTHWKGVVLFFSHFYASMHNTNAQKHSQGIT